MKQEQKGFYEFGPFRIDNAKRLLLRDQAVIPIAPKVFETLLTMVRNPGRVLEKDELLKAIWSDSFVEEASLANSISALRKILGERRNEHTFIVTVPGQGYRFVAEVRSSEEVELEETFEQQSGTLCIESNTSTSASVSTSETVSSGPFKRSTMVAIAVAILLVTAGINWWLNGSTNRRLPGLSMAVLPFLDVSGDPETIRFASGLTEQIAHTLGVEPGFTVESRPADVLIKSKKLDIRALARQLNVAAVLKGSVQRSGSQTRVTAEMTNLPGGRRLWSETYEFDGDHPMDSQATVASVVVRTLRSRFAGMSAHQLNEPPTSNDAALKWYLRAQEGWLTQRRPGLLKSVDDYQKAISEDPSYASAYAGLAASELFLASIEGTPDRVAEAKAAVNRALALNDRLTDGHAILGNIYLRREWKFMEAELELKRALELAPGHSPYEYWYALSAALRRHFGEALVEMEIGRMVNPKSETIRMATGTVHLVMRRFDLAEVWARQALELAPTNALSHQLLGLALEQQRKYSEAIAEFRICAATRNDSAQCLPALGHVLAVSGNAAEARAVLQKLEIQSEPDGVSLALLWLGLKNNARALDALDDAYRKHQPKLPWVRVDPRFDPLMTEPRFVELLNRIGLPI